MAQELESIGRRLRVLREAHGLSQVDLARMVGRHQTTIGPYERDEYTPSPDVVARLAKALDTSPEFILFGRTATRSFIRVTGRVSAAGLIDPDDGFTMRLQTLADESVDGFEVTDETMAPVFRTGQIVLVDRQEATSIMDHFASHVMAELEDGRRLLRLMAPAAQADRVTLAAHNGPSIDNAAVRRVWPVMGVIAAGLLRPVS